MGRPRAQRMSFMNQDVNDLVKPKLNQAWAWLKPHRYCALDPFIVRTLGDTPRTSLCTTHTMLSSNKREKGSQRGSWHANPTVVYFRCDYFGSNQYTFCFKFIKPKYAKNIELQAQSIFVVNEVSIQRLRQLYFLFEEGSNAPKCTLSFKSFFSVFKVWIVNLNH